MILVDTSVWIDHFRRADAALVALLRARVVVVHPFVAGALACGHLPRRDATLAMIMLLPMAPVVAHHETRSFVERHALMGRGIGWLDAHLLASALVAGVRLWSRDRRLAAVAAERGMAYAAPTR